MLSFSVKKILKKTQSVLGDIYIFSWESNSEAILIIRSQSVIVVSPPTVVQHYFPL